jgi:hypothetical protein
LIELNVERKGGILQFVEEEKKSGALVPPGMVVLLLFMLGILANILSTLITLELVIAIYEYRRLALEFMEQYCADRVQRIASLEKLWADRKKCLLEDLSGWRRQAFIPRTGNEDSVGFD